MVVLFTNKTGFHTSTAPGATGATALAAGAIGAWFSFSSRKKNSILKLPTKE
jgi:hypothetical protein